MSPGGVRQLRKSNRIRPRSSMITGACPERNTPPCLSNERGDGTVQEQVQPLIRGCKYRRLGDSVLQNRGCLPEDRWLQIVGDSKTRLHLLIGTGVCRKADDCDGNSHGQAIDERTRADCRPGNAEWPDGHCTSPWIGRWSFDGRLASSSDCLS